MFHLTVPPHFSVYGAENAHEEGSLKYLPSFSHSKVSPQKWASFFHFQPILFFNFDPNSMVMVFLGTDSKQILENRPVFIEWEQNVILLGSKVLLLFSCFQEHFVTILIWKRRGSKLKLRTSYWKFQGSISFFCAPLVVAAIFDDDFGRGTRQEHILQFSEPSIDRNTLIFIESLKSLHWTWTQVKALNLAYLDD